MLWHRDVIKLLMSLNEITCDLVAGSFHSGATVLFPKNSFKQSKWKTFAVLESSEERGRERSVRRRRRKHHEEQKVIVIKAEGRVLRQGCVAFCGVSLVYHNSVQGQLSGWPG